MILVTDPPGSGSPEGPFDRRIDQPQDATIRELTTALAACSEELIVVSDLKKLTTLMGTRPNALVFPYWFGQGSRSRHALVPSLCEANDVMFVGADAFSKTVCNDKELSKAVCRQAGISVPASVVVHGVRELGHLRGLRFPVMVKPNYEGTSLGITARNRCETMADVVDVATDLLAELRQPVIIEEFITGREFSVCLMEGATGVDVRIGAWSIDGRSDYFDDRVYSYEYKVGGKAVMTFEDASALISKKEVDRMKACYGHLGRVGFMRIDGRVSASGCFVFELTPDVYLGSDGEFAVGFRDLYPEYEDFISAIVRYGLESYDAGFPMR